MWFIYRTNIEAPLIQIQTLIVSFWSSHWAIYHHKSFIVIGAREKNKGFIFFFHSHFLFSFPGWLSICHVSLRAQKDSPFFQSLHFLFKKQKNKYLSSSNQHGHFQFPLPWTPKTILEKAPKCFYFFFFFTQACWLALRGNLYNTNNIMVLSYKPSQAMLF